MRNSLCTKYKCELKKSKKTEENTAKIILVKKISLVHSQIITFLKFPRGGIELTSCHDKASILPQGIL